MSGTPIKRLQEESVGNSSVPRYSHKESGTHSSSGSKLGFSSSNDYQMQKIRDADKRSPSLPIYRMPSTSLNYSLSDYPVTLEERMESRDLKVEERVVKTESREFYQTAKDIKHVSKMDENKEAKSGRDSYLDHRSESKNDKDGNDSGIGHQNWKESKEHHRAKRYPDAYSVDPMHTVRSNVHAPIETRKENVNTNERDFAEVHEAVGENKVDAKGEDKLKEKEKRKKDGKHTEWGEREKERNDIRNNLQAVDASNHELKDRSKDEREFEKWERERKDVVVKDNDKEVDREKDHVKRDPWVVVEKDHILPKEKDTAAIPFKAIEQKEFSEHKKHKDIDTWKDVDNKETNDRRKEKDSDMEGERYEKRGRVIDKELDDGGGDEGEVEREKEVLSHGVQPRKRMLRPRGSPQLANWEPQFRCHGPDNEVTVGNLNCGAVEDGEELSKAFSTFPILKRNHDIPPVVYRVGECMQELMKIWKEYVSSHAIKISGSSLDGPILQVRIPAEHVTATNRQVRGGQLWGTNIYTDDSDLVAVLMHTGYCRPTASPPPHAIQELCATIRVLPLQDCYTSSLRNSVRSRAWGAAIGCSYRVERCCMVKKGGRTIELEPCLTHTSIVEPTLAPVVVERTMTTRAAASNALRQQRFIREVTIQYNLCNEPWIKYSLSAVADKGLKKPLFTSARLKKGEVLYLESHSHRYELCFNGEKVIRAVAASHENEMEIDKYQTHNLYSADGERSTVDSESTLIDVFRWSCCKRPLPQKVMHSIGIPLPLEHLEVLEENLDWEDIRWSQTGVWITWKEYPIARVHFLSSN